MGYPLRYVDVEGLEPEDIILRGRNNSSVIVKTDLVDITVDAGDILGDVGGVYTLEGEDVVVAALDIVGIVDPTGVADFTAGSIELQRGNYLEGAVSYAGILPYIGDVFKLAKLPKHVQTIRRAIELSKVGKIVSSGKRIENVHGFASMEKLMEHYQRHAVEFGGKIRTPQQYLKSAQNFFKREGDEIMQYTRPNGEIVRYDVKNNIFGVVKPDGTIKTFFKPKDRIEYLRKQIRIDLLDIK